MGTIACNVTFTTPQGVFGNAAHMNYKTLAELVAVALDEGDSRAEVASYDGGQWVTVNTDCHSSYRFDRDELAVALESQGVEWGGASMI